MYNNEIIILKYIVMIVNVNDNPDVVAVIVTLGANIQRLMNCIESLYNQHSQLKLAILCIVNSPVFDTHTLDLTRVTVVTTGLNLGFAGGLSFSRQFINAAYLWIIQDDMLVEKNCLDQLFLKLNNELEMAATAPIIVSPQGEVIQGSCGGILNKFGKMQRWLPTTSTLPEYLIELDLLSYIPSRGMLIKTTAWDAVQGVDARYYPVGWTDVDLCMAFRQQGFKFMMITTAVAWHEINGSTPSMLGQFLFHKNNALFIAKWFTHDLEKHPQLLHDPLRPCSATLLCGKVNAEIDQLLLNTVAQRATNLFLQLGHEYTANLKFAQEKLQSVTANYEQSKRELMVEIQSLTAKYEESTQELKQELQFVSAQYEQTKQQLMQTHTSISWQLTQPLRKLKAMILKYAKLLPNWF